MRLSIAFLPGLFLGLALAGCDRQKAQDPQGEAPLSESAVPVQNASAPNSAEGRLDRSRAGTRAPDIGFEDPAGRPTSLTAFHGQPLLVNLWATWCAPCVVEMPSLDALAKREGDALTVVALSQDFGGREKVTEFFGRHRFERLQPYLDNEMKIMSALRVDTLPTTILYDTQGREVWRMTGIADWTSERSAQLLAEARRR